VERKKGEDDKDTHTQMKRLLQSQVLSAFSPRII
jgi:hypothetical protein